MKINDKINIENNCVNTKIFWRLFMIKRDYYLNKLIKKQNNGLVKVITGPRRVGKSYLLFNIFYNYLLNNKVGEDHIILLSLDDIKNQRYWNPNELDNYIRSKIINDGKTNYVFIDEIQFVRDVPNPYLADSFIGFTEVVLGLVKIKNVDLYITGSNSKMLSKDILTSFRGKSDNISIKPLSYKEFYSAYQVDKSRAWNEYLTYGGMPFVLSLNDYSDKSDYLKNLFSETYIKDIIDRNDIKSKEAILAELLNIISSSIGSLTNPLKLANTFKSIKKTQISSLTIQKYLDLLEDSFLIEKSKRYDVKGKKYIETPHKYYFTDLGLRNARLNFSQVEETHIMENIIYNELRGRGFNVDIGILELNYKENNISKRKQVEIDFIATRGSEKIYIQSAYSVASNEKLYQETRGLVGIKDSFKKIVVVRDNIVPRKDENGILYIGVEEFLLDEKYTSTSY